MLIGRSSPLSKSYLCIIYNCSACIYIHTRYISIFTHKLYEYIVIYAYVYYVYHIILKISFPVS